MSALVKQLSALILFMSLITGRVIAEETKTENGLSGIMAGLSDGAVIAFIAVFAVVLFLLLVILVLLFVRSVKTRELYKNQMTTLSAIYRSLPDLVFSKDMNGAYTSCNHSYEEFAGRSESEIIGNTPIDIFPYDKDFANSLMEADRKVLTGNTISKSEEWMAFPGRPKKLMERVKTPLIQNGKVIGLLGISRDITEHKAAEDAAYEASRAKSNFLAKMSHEIRTPMNAIIGMAELALREKDLYSAQKHLLTVKQAGAHLLSIINDILDFSKIEVGKLEIIPADYLFSSLINDVISIIRMRVMDSQIRFAVTIDSMIPNSLIGDETRMRQVLLNILTNAVKYTEKGFVSFTVYGEKTDENNINLVMEIMDSGKGMKQEDLKNLFGEYVQFEHEKNRRIDGVGLGLAITWNIVKAMGGDINVHSEYGKGSTFTITVAQKIRSPEPMALVDNPEEMKVIVYERREIYANSIISTVDNLGVQASLVSDDSEFYERMANKKYNFIFISFSLFERNSETLSKFGANAKIIILSDFGESIPDKKLSVLAMPVYAISIANILNGESSSFSFNETDEHIVRFTAPSARVLIVDDINTNLKVAEGLMLPYKMQVDICTSGREAIEKVKNNHYDLVFMDHKMPEMDGMETTQCIREMGSADSYFSRVPIVILTANAVSGTKEIFLNSGFNDFLSKPIDTIKLNSVLERWIPRGKKDRTNMEVFSADREKKEDVNTDIAIEGVDVKRGIFLSGGKIEMYLDTLAVFCSDGFKKTGEIVSCLEKGDISLYTVHVHALKSALANIGADKLSEAAKELEMAGVRNDLSFIGEHNASLVMGLESLLNKIKNAVSQAKETAGKNRAPYSKETLKAELEKLKTALDVLDAGTINNTIDSLRNAAYPDDIAAVIESLSEKILIGEYDEASELIKNMQSEGDNGTH